MKKSGASIHIVVGFDFSPLGTLALQEAAALAADRADTAIHVVNVRSEPGRQASSESSTEDLVRELEEHMRASTRSLLETYGAGGEVEVVIHALVGDPAPMITSIAEDVEADLIIVGTHGRRGLKRMFLGSVAEEVMREACCPVLVMRPRRRDPHPELEPEPACADCLKAREATGGASLWCEVHDRPWVPAHRYSYQSGDVRPYHPDGLG